MINDEKTELETRYALALEAGRIGLWTWDAQTNIIDLDARAREMLGSATDTLTLERINAAVHPDDLAAKCAAWTAARDPQGDSSYQVEYRHTRSDNGQISWIVSSGRAQFKDDLVARIVGVMRDVTERREAEAELQQVASQMAGIISIAADAIISIDAEQRITLFNDGAEVIFGYRRDEIIGQSLAHLLPEQFRASHGAHIQDFGKAAVAARRMGERGEILGRRKNGQTFLAEASISKLDVGGKRLYTAVLRDVTERREVARQLQHSKRVLEIALEAGNIGLFESDQINNVLFLSPMMRNMCGISDEEPTTVARFLQLVHETDRQRLSDGLARSYAPASGGMLDIEFQIVLPDGEKRWLAFQAHTAFRNGLPERSVGAVVDITERRQFQDTLVEKIKAGTRELKQEMRRREQSQAQLLRTQRMEAFGQLTGGIAHDFNNLLTVITGNLELLEMRLKDEKQRVLLSRAQDAADMGARLTGRLLTFARRRQFKTSALNLNEHVMGMAELLERTLGEPITLTTVLERAPWTVLADASEIENAILNLAINARDAMPNGGKLIIQTSNVKIAANEIGGETKLRQGRYMRLTMSDTGIGMSGDVQQKAFEPFFTTTEPGKGTGLGLSTIYGFVQQSNGAVTIESELGRGTTVSLYLPQADQETERADQSAAHTDAPLTLHARVLLVEDNPDVRHVTRSQLEALGCVVVEASSGPAAVEILQSGQVFDIVFSDVVMAGGMSGFDVARWVRDSGASRGGCRKVLLASGYPDDVLRAQDPNRPEIEILRKPYSRRELADALRRTLEG